MSRAYRVSVSESVRRYIHVEDKVQSRLELLEILPCDEMAELLAQELEKLGFERKDGVLVRTQDGVEVTVDPKTGQVTARAEKAAEVELDSKAETSIADRGDYRNETQEEFQKRVEQARGQLRKQLEDQLERKAEDKQREFQRKATEALEKSLRDTQRELDQGVNRVTAEALKRRAAQLGRIKEMSEEEDGSLTIKVEV